MTATEVRDAVDEAFLELRNRAQSLDEARDSLSDEQARVWRYFLPRKHREILYATNYEGEGEPVSGIFYDIDRGPEVSAEQALAVTRAFVEFLEADPVAERLTPRDRSVSRPGWAGRCGR